MNGRSQRILRSSLDYVVQQYRFTVDEGFGCGTAGDGSILYILLVYSWSVIPPLISVTVYFRTSNSPQATRIANACIFLPARVVRIFYCQSREINSFLQSNDSVSRTNYIRIMLLASVDVLLTLPIGIATIALVITQSMALDVLSFYPGWAYTHTEWDWSP